MKIFIALFAFLSIGLISSPYLHANEMSSIEYDIELKSDGSGVITETRRMYLTEDTEIYITLDHLAGSEVTNFQVSDFGEPFNYESEWDISASREEKAGKYGIVETNDGLELAWGIGEYGEHEYTVAYTITNMVRNLEDGQGMNWKFFDGENNITPDEMEIRIAGPQPFSTESTRIWGFGFDGEVYLEDGGLVGWSNSALSDSNNITILIQFSDRPFQPSLSLDQTLSEQQEVAMEGSSYNEESSDAGFIAFLIIAGFSLIIFILISIYTILRSRAIKRENPLVTGKQREKINEDKYYRSIPYQQGPITDIAYLLQGIATGSMEDYFNAYLLKWLKEERVSIKKEETGRFRKKETTIIKLDLRETFQSEFEQRFWELLSNAANSDGILYDDQLKKSAQKQYQEIQKIETDLANKSKKQLVKMRYLAEGEVKFMGGLTAKVIKGTERGETLFNHIVQFKNYLDDFSLINEREMKEVALWDDLLIWASLYGIADEVAKQLERFYPSYFEEGYISYTDIYLMHIFTRSMTSGYQSAVSASQGGGGSTSIGGGGGSFGGGGGGSR